MAEQPSGQSEDEMLKNQLTQDDLARGPFGKWIK